MAEGKKVALITGANRGLGFETAKQLGEKMGIKHVEAGPLVRSSYHAFEQEEAARA